MTFRIDFEHAGRRWVVFIEAPNQKSARLQFDRKLPSLVERVKVQLEHEHRPQQTHR